MCFCRKELTFRNLDGDIAQHFDFVRPPPMKNLPQAPEAECGRKDVGRRLRGHFKGFNRLGSGHG